MTDYVCEKCRESISAEATACPHCSYDAGKSHRRWKLIHGILGIILCGTLIGAPVGFYAFWKGRKHRKKSESASPAVPA